jgi:hypothetical protein
MLLRGSLRRRAAAAAAKSGLTGAAAEEAEEEGAAREAAAAAAAVVFLGLLGGMALGAELLLLALASAALAAADWERMGMGRFPRSWSSWAVRGRGGGMPVSTTPLGPTGAAEAAPAALAPEAVAARMRTGRGGRCLPAEAAAAATGLASRWPPAAAAARSARWPPAAAAEGAAALLPPDMSAGRMLLVFMEPPLPEEWRPEVSMDRPTEAEAAPAAAGPVRFMAKEPAAAAGAGKAACRPAVGGCAEGGPAWTEPAWWGGGSMCACWEAAWGRACREAGAEEGLPR